MKRTFAAAVGLIALGTSAALAADLPVKAPVYTPPAFSWTGCYIGGNIGTAWTDSNWSDSLFGLAWGGFTGNARFIGGGQVGCNYQFNNPGFVIGLEGDFDWVERQVNGNNTVVGPRSHTFFLSSNDTGVATLAARFGFAYEHALFYGKAGAGWVSNDGFAVTDVTTSQSFVASSSNSAGGWLVGAGIEYAVTNYWTVKLEYDYLGFPNRSLVVPATVIPALAGDTITGGHNVQMVKVGFNYLFSWAGPVVAKY